jgi:hypothetical protein
MFSGSDGLAAAVASAKEQDLKPLAEECTRKLGLDADQAATMGSYLEDAWFFGIRVGHAVMAETSLGETDPKPVVLAMQNEFQDLMEGLADALDSTVGVTIDAWNYLGCAWIDGAKFWNVEIAARLIEGNAGGLDEALRRLQE